MAGNREQEPLPCPPPSPALVSKLRAFITGRVRDPWDADDVLQDVLLRLHDRRHQLRDDRGALAWSYRIARNAIIDHHRARHRSREEPRDAVPETMARPVGGVQDAATQTRRALTECVGPLLLALPAHYREALTLVELEQLTQADAARAAGISLSGMKSRVQRGRRRAQALIEDWCSLHYDGRGAPVSYFPRCHRAGQTVKEDR